MRRQTLIILGALELLALTLAHWQALGNVRTDEAKYLLNIPYPHPPLLRWLMSLTEIFPFQEFLLRFLLASLMIQGVWMVWDIRRSWPMEDKAVLSAGWLLSSAVLLQAGTIMLAPFTALQALGLLWVRSRPSIANRRPALIGLCWLASLFTAYQAILFAPLVWSVLRKAGRSRRETSLYVLGPILLLILWSLSNPLALETMLIHGNEGASGAILDRLMGAGKLWIVGGAGVISILGTWGIFRSRDRALQLSFLLVSFFILASVPYPFYAILFAPCFVGGLTHLLEKKIHPPAFPLMTSMLAGSVVVTLLMRPSMDHDAARQVIQALNTTPDHTVLINGSFGHHWQYESRASVRRYKPALAQNAHAVICLNTCDPMFNTSGWKRLTELPVETWVRKQLSW